jgi:predicted transport protein
MKIKQDEIHDTIQQARPNLKDISIKQYEQQLKKLKNLFETESYDFLSKPKEVESKLEGLHYTSVRNTYNAIIVLLLALNKDSTYDKLIEQYTELRDQLNTKYEEEQKSGVISDKQKNNFASMEEINKLLSQLKTEITQLKKKKTLTQRDVSTIRSWILFNMLIRIPTRNDASNMLYITQRAYKNLSQKDKEEHNYLVNERNNMKFIYNVYKTSKKYGENIIHVPADLKPMIRTYLKLMDYKTGDNIFPMSRNAISQLLSKTSKRIIDKSVSSTLVRKIYMSEKYAKVKEEMKADSKLLGHSVSMGQSVYTKSKE